MIVHQMRESGIPCADAVPAQDIMESYLHSASPNAKAVREFVDMCDAAGIDEEAIGALKLALIHDNATSANEGLAMLCLTDLLVLAGKCCDNRRRMIFDGSRISTFDAIIEAAQIYPGSAEIQHKVCALLMLLSMEYKQNVARNGGCKAILDAMRIHVEEGALQVTAMDALEVLLSCDGVGASTLLSRAGMSIVADVMRAHENNPEIRTRGRAILGNLVLDEESRTAVPVSET